MKRKKVLTMLAVAALTVAQVAMPVSAAGGSLNVPVKTKNPIIRVKVPTTMVVAVDQFGVQDDGDQIASDEFSIENYSDVAVSVKVDSVVTTTNSQSSGIKLVDTVEAVKTSEEKNGAAWLAMAAAKEYDTSDGKYVYNTRLEEDTVTKKDVGDLSEKDENVTTFVVDASTTTKANASQTFYLQKVKDSSATTVKNYLLKGGNGNNADKVPYAEFYKLTKLDGLTSSKEKEDLEAKVAAGTKVYYADTAALSSAGGTGFALTEWVSGGSYNGSNTYYSADEDATSATDTKSGTDADLYVYSEINGDTIDKAAFTYIGMLSDSKEDAWTKADISNIDITYTIVGVTVDKYDAVKDGLKQGYYSTVPAFASNTKGVISYTLGAGDDEYAELVSVTTKYGGKLLNCSAHMTHNESAGTITFLDKSLANFINEDSSKREITITYKNKADETVTVVVLLKLS